MLHRLICAFAVLWMAGCAPGEAPLSESREGDKEILDVDPGYRSVGFEYRGPIASGLSSSTAVWPVSRRWYDVTPESGPAWSVNSGLTWDEKYSAWVDAMDMVIGDDGHATVELITPWGKKLPSPRLECAELAMFMRVAFASWYELPFFMSAWSSNHGTILSGHFGIVKSNGSRVTGTPNYSSVYTDHTQALAGRSNAYIVANWPTDSSLASKYLTSSKDDYNTFLGPDAYAGAYFDEVFLNKRVGHFLVRLLTWHGSMHLASANNMWNLEPTAIDPGDVLLHRWQSQGIGHVMVVKEVTDLGAGQIDAEIVFGSMPRIQPRWYNASISKSYFTSDYAGSRETSSEGDRYSELGGGLKRWRTPILTGGYWTNIVPVADRDDWIGSTDYATLEGRIETFQQILGNLSPEEQRDVLLERIDMARANLEQRPASCANRQRREEAFDDLYTLMADEWGWTREQTDRQYRILADYALAELSYNDSKTCCWNSTTSAMFDIILEYNETLVADADSDGQCVEPVVFMARDGGGYDPFRSYAYDTGRGGSWVEWSDDESCPQAGVSDDTQVGHEWTAFCDVVESVMGWDECANGDPPATWYLDDDNDGYGVTGELVEACTEPSGYTASPGDCADGDRYVHPGATEVCDGIDNNCDGRVDEGCGGPDDPGSDPGTGTGGTDCSEGCGANQLQGPSPLAMLFLGGLGFGLRRRRVA